MKNAVRPLLVIMSMACLIAVAGCGKKVQNEPAATAIAPPTAVAPTAHISATPTAIRAGDLIELSWTTTDATTVSIEGLGTVPASGRKTLSLESTTTFRLIARGDGGTSQDSVKVVVKRAQVKEKTEEQKPAPAVKVAMNEEELFKANVQDVYFAFDDYSLTDEAHSILSKDADFLVQHPNMDVFIGGYCDERGSVEYNLSLGEYRAESAKKALIMGGVWEKRIRVTSFGKERPFCTESNEECWAKNRRAHITPEKQ